MRWHVLFLLFSLSTSAAYASLPGAPCQRPSMITSVRAFEPDQEIPREEEEGEAHYLLDTPEEDACLALSWLHHCNPKLHLQWLNHCEGAFTVTCELDSELQPGAQLYTYHTLDAPELVCHIHQGEQTRTYQLLHAPIPDELWEHGAQGDEVSAQSFEARASGGCGCVQAPRHVPSSAGALLVLGLLGWRRRRS